MALLFIDGFDHLGSGVSPTSYGKWASTGGAVQTLTSPVRTGTYSLEVFNATLIGNAVPASGGVVVGVAVNLGGAFSDTPLIQVREDSTQHLVVGVTSGGLLTMSRGGTLLATGTHALSLNIWYYLELLATIDDTTGSYELRKDGVAELTASGVDTRNGGTTGQWNTIALIAVSPTDGRFDDFYLCDTSGAAPRNTFLGAVKIETLFPQTDAVAAGSNAGLTPSTGTDHGALVDEAAPNTTDYNAGSTVGVKDTYQFPSMTLTGTILGVQTNLYVNKSDAVARQVCAVVRAGGVDYDGANVAPLTSFRYFSEIRAQNPNTTAEWTTSDVTSLQAGMKVTV